MILNLMVYHVAGDENADLKTVDLAARVDAFQAASEDMRAKYDDGTWRNHYQNTNAISTMPPKTPLMT